MPEAAIMHGIIGLRLIRIRLLGQITLSPTELENVPLATITSSEQCSLMHDADKPIIYNNRTDHATPTPTRSNTLKNFLGASLFAVGVAGIPDAVLPDTVVPVFVVVPVKL